MQMSRASRKLGVAVVGIGGAVATTAAAGVEMLNEIWAVYGGVLAEHFGPAVRGHENEISKVFGDTADSIQGICETRIAEAEQACEEAEAASGADPA